MTTVTFDVGGISNDLMSKGLSKALISVYVIKVMFIMVHVYYVYQ